MQAPSRSEVLARFDFHPPKDETVKMAHEHIRSAMGVAAMQVMDLCPHSRESSNALTALQEAMMWANAAIAIHQDRKDA